jgi:hypothetical protein
MSWACDKTAQHFIFSSQTNVNRIAKGTKFEMVFFLPKTFCTTGGQYRLAKTD